MLKGRADVNATQTSVSTTRVGRWMSLDEYNKMVETGKVQVSPNGNTTFVANPADINAYSSAPPNSIYVEFDVVTDAIYPAGQSNWGQIPGPDSNLARYNDILGRPPIADAVAADNIVVVGGN